LPVHRHSRNPPRCLESRRMILRLRIHRPLRQIGGGQRLEDFRIGLCLTDVVVLGGQLDGQLLMARICC
jgi:hypothetical protein